MNTKLLKILALLESDNDAEALQALRTAQKLLQKSKTSLQQIVEEREKSGRGGHQRENNELSNLQLELRRYRQALDAAYAERDVLETHLSKVQEFLKSNQSLKLFQRLKEREENVRALTKEVRRLKDECYLKERQIRELQRQKSGPSESRVSESRVSESRVSDTRQRGQTVPPTPPSVKIRPHPPVSGVPLESDFKSPEQQNVFAPEHLEKEIVKEWIRHCGFKSSHEETDWVSAKMLFQIFVGGEMKLVSGRTAQLLSEKGQRKSMGLPRFAQIFAELLEQVPVTLGSRGSRRGFRVVSHLDLGGYEVSKPPSPNFSAPDSAGVPNKTVKRVKEVS